MSGGGHGAEAAVAEVLERGRTDPAAAHVFTRTYAADALAAARAADVAAPGPERPLAGLPVTIKDLFDVAGETTLSGTSVRRGLPAAEADAVVVARLRRSGAAITGRTNMVEYAFGGVGLNPHLGTPRNPADPDVARVPGGSSSGAAVSVGLGLAVAAVGSDTAGSVRIPAALCGLVGFKPTQRRVPLTGAVELSRSLDSIGPIAHSVADCLTLDAVLADDPLDVAARPLSGMRLAAATTLVLDDLEPAVATAYERALRILADAGASVEEVPLPQLGRIAELNQPAGLSPIECYAAHGELVRSRHDEVDPRVWQRMAPGHGISAADYLAIQDRRARWIAETERALPSTPCCARRCRSWRRRSPSWRPPTRPTSPRTGCSCATPSSSAGSTAAPSRCPATRPESCRSASWSRDPAAPMPASPRWPWRPSWRSPRAERVRVRR
ncbi:amidase family protein [Janibacter terrae]|uniref:amidase family protein n=1 Tax=Janibacter terrae TaxID=103817 RepID=UPI000A69D79B|nr:amidase family protein [Janibacter terrae]